MYDGRPVPGKCGACRWLRLEIPGAECSRYDSWLKFKADDLNRITHVYMLDL
jgi:hypothetical protein